MADELPVLDVRDRQEWRAWLQMHHACSSGVWLVFHKGHSNVVSIPYEDSVLEALCFGWIDSLIKRLDVDRYGRKFTPRQPTSKWSDINRNRWRMLNEAGLLTRAGLAAAPTENRYAPLPVVPDLPDFIEAALKTNGDAWAFFQQLAPTYRRQYVAWIHTAKRPETRQKRLNESLARLAAGERLGLR